MKVYELVAAAVLRVGQADGSLRALSWTELGQAFGVTKDQARHQLNRFKDKYNVVDADVKTPGWSREFLNSYTPEAEKAELVGIVKVPGDVVTIGDLVGVVKATNGLAVYLDAAGEVQESYGVGSGESSDQDEFVEVEEGVDEYHPPVLTIEAPKAATQIAPLKFLITPTVLVVVRDGLPLTIDKSHKNFEKIQTSLEAGEWQAVLDFIDLKNTLTKYSNGRVLVENGAVTLDGERVNGKVVQRLVDALVEENLEQLEAISAFLAKCDENPDYRVVTRIYDFMAHNDLRLTKEGDILAYKVVRSSYLDKHSGTMDNSPGKIVKMKRNQVNPKDEETCSHGLHVASRKYIPSFGSPSLHAGGERVVLCKVNPKDFVSIPTDYNSQKARVCEYLVLKDVTELFCNHQLDDEGVKA